MTENQNPLAIRRILVAIDTSPHSLAAAETAVDLAAKLQAELLGLFVEDIGLFDLAVSPYARRILYPSAEEAPVSRATVESELKAQSEQARKVLATAADQSRVPWSFRTVRGEVVAEVLAAAGGADLLAMGRVGWSLGKQLRIGSTALEVVAAKNPVLLLSERCMPQDLRLLVCYDGSLPSKKRLLAAAHWASRGIDGLRLFCRRPAPRLLIR
jgi:nucleotide-binding universal stress UspA family protein